DCGFSGIHFSPQPDLAGGIPRPTGSVQRTRDFGGLFVSRLLPDRAQAPFAAVVGALADRVGPGRHRSTPVLAPGTFPDPELHPTRGLRSAGEWLLHLP